MDLAIYFGLVVLGGVILYFGAEWLVDGAAGLARALGVKELIIGLTVVAWGTSAPELAVSISANLDGSSELVFGNVIGSCVTNIGLILGITALIAPPNVDPALIRRDIPVLVVSAVLVPCLLYFLDGVPQWAGTVLLVFATMYTIFSFTAPSEEEDPAERDDASIARLAMVTIFGLGLLVGGGELFVRGARGVALHLGMSESIVGLTIVAFGTSVPELATSLVGAVRGHSGIAIGNVVGSNIYNVFLVLGASGTIRTLPGSFMAQRPEFVFLVGLTFFAAIAMRSERTVSRLEGAIFLCTYVAFIGYSVVRA